MDVLLWIMDWAFLELIWNFMRKERLFHYFICWHLFFQDLLTLIFILPLQLYFTLSFDASWKIIYIQKHSGNYSVVTIVLNFIIYFAIMIWHHPNSM